MIFSKISNIRPFSLSLVSLLKSGFTPTATQFNQFLFFLSKSKRFKLIIHLVKSNQLKGDSKTRRIFIEALVKEDKYDEAVQCLKEKNTQMEKYLFDSLIQLLCKRNPEKALSILQDCSVNFREWVIFGFPLEDGLLLYGCSGYLGIEDWSERCYDCICLGESGKFARHLSSIFTSTQQMQKDKP